MKRYEFEIYQTSVYCDIVAMIMENHHDLSLAKLLFFAYAANKEMFFDKGVYTAGNSVDILSKEISTISGDFKGFANAVPFILKAIHLLNSAGVISISGENVHLGSFKYKCVRRDLESNFLSKVIEASKGWTDKQFMREVLQNV